MTRRELERMVQALTDGTLREIEFAQLQAELRANAESREFFRKSMEIEILLTETMGHHAVIGEKRELIERRQQRQQRKMFTRTLLATAAILMVAGVVMALVHLKRPEPRALTGTPVPGTQWQVMGDAHASARNVRKVVEGSTVAVRSGSVKLEFDSGMVMLLGGPAEVSFSDLDRPVLKRGWLWVDSEDFKASITVETPGLRVRDIGTRFGVRVREDGLTEIHLVDGSLEVVSRSGQRGKMILKPDGKGVFLSESGQPSELPLAPDPFPSLPELLASAPDYPTTVQSQGPAGYWRLDEPSGKELANEIREGVTGVPAEGVSLGQAGADRDHGYHGFPPDNRSVEMSGHPFNSVLMHLDKPGGVKREEGAVSFWIRRPAGVKRDEILWLAGDGSYINPENAFMHTRLCAAGRVEFHIENSGFDILLASNFSVADDHWHHIAASWGPFAVELYVDGRRVARADDFGKLPQGIISGRYVRFGKPSIDLQTSGKGAFAGSVDEIAIWSRPLSGAEIAHQFQAAQGIAGESHLEDFGGE